jgi:ATP-dependent Lon protease
MNKNDFVQYNMTGAMTYTKNKTLKPEDYCNGFIVTNTGGCIVTVNGHVLYPGTPGTINGDSFTYGGNLGEVYTGNIKITFEVAGANPQCTVNQKFYNLEKTTK